MGNRGPLNFSVIIFLLIILLNWKIENKKTKPKPSTIDYCCCVTRTPLARLYSLAFEPIDFAPVASIQDVRVALRESGAFSDDEIDEIDAKLMKNLFD